MSKFNEKKMVDEIRLLALDMIKNAKRKIPSALIRLHFLRKIYEQFVTFSKGDCKMRRNPVKYKLGNDVAV